MQQYDITTMENLHVVAELLAGSMLEYSSAFLLLSGDLGSGKTTLTQEVARLLGVREIVQSPTYSLLKSYTLSGLDGRMFHHLDLYRSRERVELEAAGIIDLMSRGEGYFIVEWPKFLEGILPYVEKVLTCHLSLSVDGVRQIVIEETI